MMNLDIWKQQTQWKEPLVLRSFLNVWRMCYPKLQIQKTGSDFCDTCTQLRNKILSTADAERRKYLLFACQYHRKITAAKLNFYTDKCDVIVQNPFTSEVHITFDYAEKILLPSIWRQLAIFILSQVWSWPFRRRVLEVEQSVSVWVTRRTLAEWKCSQRGIVNGRRRLSIPFGPVSPLWSIVHFNVPLWQLRGQKRNRWVLWCVWL